MMQRIQKTHTTPSLIENDRLRRESIRYTALFFVVFGLIFTLLGIFVYQTVSSNIFKAVDEQLSLPSFGVIVDTVPSAALSVDNPYGESSDADPSADDVGSNDSLGEASLSETIYSSIENNPQTIFLARSSDGSTTDTYGIYASYPDSIEGLPFDSSVLNTPYPIDQNGHHYRAVNYRIEGNDGSASYMQAIANVDSEIAILNQFTAMLVGGLVVALVVSAGASYLLSRMTLRPIADAWAKQTEFVQNASHELRTPLAIILAAQERLLAEPGARIVDRFEDVGAVADETKRLARLVDDLMTLTSVDASAEDECEAAPVEVSGLVEDVGSLYADVAEVAGKMLTVAALPAGEAHIEADALRQVLGILLDNALKYTEEGDAVIVSCEERGGRVVLSVTDTGCGICPADRERVFERFYRADAARTTPGSGLGLSIARALVERARGTIVVETNEPRGTRITVTLPKARAH